MGKQGILGIDSNAKSHWWFSGMTDARGSTLQDFIIQHNLMLHQNVENVVLNLPSEHSTCFFIHGGSWIDITPATPSAVNEVQKWNFRDCIASDHRLICYEFNGGSATGSSTASHARHRHNVKYPDWDIFEETLAVSVPEEEWFKPEEDIARGLSNAIMAACSSSIPVKKMRQFKSP
jgi:hypothetical protein